MTGPETNSPNPMWWLEPEHLATFEKQLDALFDDLKKRVHNLTQPKSGVLSGLKNYLGMGPQPNPWFRNPVQTEARLTLEAVNQRDALVGAFHEALTASPDQYIDDVIDQYRAKFKDLVRAHFVRPEMAKYDLVRKKLQYDAPPSAELWGYKKKPAAPEPRRPLFPIATSPADPLSAPEPAEAPRPAHDPEPEPAPKVKPPRAARPRPVKAPAPEPAKDPRHDRVVLGMAVKQAQARHGEASADHVKKIVAARADRLGALADEVSEDEKKHYLDLAASWEQQQADRSVTAPPETAPDPEAAKAGPPLPKKIDWSDVLNMPGDEFKQFLLKHDPDLKTVKARSNEGGGKDKNYDWWDTRYRQNIIPRLIDLYGDKMAEAVSGGMLAYRLAARRPVTETVLTAVRNKYRSHG